jgi:hypothetical protein
VNGLNTAGTATSPIHTFWTGCKVAVEARCVAPVYASVKGTGLPVAGYMAELPIDRTRPSIAGIGARFGATGLAGVVDPDQVMTVVPAAADQGIPPRRKPPRC